MGLIFNRGENNQAECGKHHFGEKTYEKELKITRKGTTIRIIQPFTQRCLHEDCTAKKKGKDRVSTNSSWVLVDGCRYFIDEGALIDDIKETIREKIEEHRNAVKEEHKEQ